MFGSFDRFRIAANDHALQDKYRQICAESQIVF